MDQWQNEPSVYAEPAYDSETLDNNDERIRDIAEAREDIEYRREFDDFWSLEEWVNNNTLGSQFGTEFGANGQAWAKMRDNLPLIRELTKSNAYVLPAGSKSFYLAINAHGDVLVLLRVRDENPEAPPSVLWKWKC